MERCSLLSLSPYQAHGHVCFGISLTPIVQGFLWEGSVSRCGWLTLHIGNETQAPASPFLGDLGER